MKQNAKCKKCGRYLNNRIVTVDAIIVQDKRILLVKRGKDPYKDYYALPGGIVNIDNDIKETIIKEAKEETGLNVKINKYIGFYDDPRRDLSERHSITFAYSVNIISGKVRAGDDAKETKWFDLDKLPKLAFDHEQMIEDYIKTR